jgi:hypothetical protein
MRQKISDLGYSLSRESKDLLVLSKLSCLPIVQLEKFTYEDEWSGITKTYWNLRPLCMKDEEIDAVLPRDWRDKRICGFLSLEEAKSWMSL